MPAPLSQAELAQSYGFALSFLKSDPSLWNLFNQAVKGNWAADKFVAALKSTSWYKTNGETARQYNLLKSTDPATLNARRAALRAQMGDAANQMGAVINAKTMNTVVENALKFNWNDSQVRDVLAQYVKSVNGIYQGSAGDDVSQLQQTAWRNGVHISSNTLNAWAKNMSSGGQSATYFQRKIRQMAKSVAPGYAEELDSGMDLYDVAQPYMQSMAKILEKNPADIDLFNADIRNAIGGRTKDGKPASMSIWQFEQSLRQKPEWLKTQNAQDSIMATGKKVLQDFGFQAV